MKKELNVRKCRFSMQLTKEENEILAENASKLHLNKAEYVRRLIIYGDIIGQHPVLSEAQGKELLQKVTDMSNAIMRLAYTESYITQFSYNNDASIREECLNILSLLGSLAIMEEADLRKWRLQVSTLYIER